MTLTLRSRTALGASGAALALLLAACGGGSSPTAGSSGPSAPAVTPSGQVLAAATTPLGKILVDGKGMTVYMFAADPGGKSVCNGSCAQYWPPVPAPATLPSSVAGVSAMLGSTTRDDGSKQLTVSGRPVYTYAGDKAPGSTAGQGTNLSGGIWWVLSPSGAIVKKTAGAAPASSSPMAGYRSGY